MTIKELGNFPNNGENARESKEFTKVTYDTALKVVSGKKSPVLLNFYVSNDVVHVGEMIIPTGGIGPRQTEYDMHKGDAVLYVKNGPATIYLPDLNETYHVENDDFMFVPENTKYKIINYTDQTLKIIFIVAPYL